ncbi:MAG: septum formation initiator family protein [Acidimicrobiia bacterium]|nr:septum formation initiator family protein [Acidimicrobiia bacterium]
MYPTQTWFRQRDELDAKKAQLAEAQETNERLEERVDELKDPEEVELMAREEFGLVRPGEEVYALVPDERHPVELPRPGPSPSCRRRIGQTRRVRLFRSKRNLFDRVLLDVRPYGRAQHPRRRSPLRCAAAGAPPRAPIGPPVSLREPSVPTRFERKRSPPVA